MPRDPLPNEGIEKWLSIPGTDDPLLLKLKDAQTAALFWRDKAEMLEKKYSDLFPINEAPGRIVMLLWDGRTWLRLADKAYSKTAVDEMKQIQVEFRDSLTDALRGKAAFDVSIEPDWKAEYERLDKLVKKAEGQQWASPEVQALFKSVQSRPEPLRVERTRRNNVVT